MKICNSEKCILEINQLDQTSTDAKNQFLPEQTLKRSSLMLIKKKNNVLHSLHLITRKIQTGIQRGSQKQAYGKQYKLKNPSYWKHCIILFI